MHALRCYLILIIRTLNRMTVSVHNIYRNYNTQSIFCVYENGTPAEINIMNYNISQEQ